MNDESRKRLTEYLRGKVAFVIFPDGDIGYAIHGVLRRVPSFTTYNDFGALKDKLVENGKWEDFHYYATQICNRMFRPFEFSKWLFRPESCALVDEYLKSKEGKCTRK